MTRPIPDRVKESLFGMLRGHCEGANVFDGFAGTGALGLETLSRGAARCVCIEQDKGVATTILSRNVEMLGVKDRCEVVVGDALGAGALARAPRPLTIAFLDPPYPLVLEPIGYKRVMAQLEKLVGLLSPDGIAVLRTPWPLRHRVGGAAPVVGAVPRPAPKLKRKGPKVDRREWRRMAGEAPEMLETPERGVDEEVVEEVVSEPGAEAPAADDSKGPWAEASLVLPNAQGPETHVYHNMAVHLYMRK